MGDVLMKRGVPWVPKLVNAPPQILDRTSPLVSFNIRGSRKLISSGRT